jgi:hypothetical protein
MNKSLRTVLRLGAMLVSGLPLTGCGQDSDRPSDVHTLRVLAVRAETPFGKPGRAVDLTMLAYDGAPGSKGADGLARTTSMLWIGGCNNPPGDSYAACMPYLKQVLSRLGTEDLASGVVPADVPAGILGWGEHFTAEIPTDLISARPTAPGVVYRYGIQMVFFAYCGGTLRRETVDGADFPLGCFDAATGERLGRDDFEFGFYPLFVYDSLENQNPEIAAIRLAGADLGVDCTDSPDCPEGSRCGSTGTCIPIVARCRQADEDDCESHTLSVEVPRRAVERAAVAHVAKADADPETLWVSYFANAGSFEQDARIINDPHSGWSDDTDGKWRANVGSSREVRLWAVVRDNRNGVAWGVRDLWVE